MASAMQPTESLGDPSAARIGATEGRDRIIDRVSLVVTLGVLIWSSSELINLVSRHTTGAELYGVLTAALATGAAVANVVVLRSPGTRAVVTIALIVLWAVIALAGVAGVLAHIVGPVADHGPIDPRPRPILAPLVFTLLGMLGGSALLFGWRAGRRPKP